MEAPRGVLAHSKVIHRNNSPRTYRKRSRKNGQYETSQRITQERKGTVSQITNEEKIYKINIMLDTDAHPYFIKTTLANTGIKTNLIIAETANGRLRATQKYPMALQLQTRKRIDIEAYVPHS